MTIRYQMKPGDLVALTLYTYARLPSIVIMFVLLPPLVGTDVVIDPTLNLPASEKFLIFIVVSAIVLLATALFFITYIVLSIRSKSNKIVMTEHAVSLSETSITQETIYHRSESKWMAVQKLARTKRHIFIYITKYGGYVIPRRAFTDEIQWDSFYEYCERMTKV